MQLIKPVLDGKASSFEVLPEANEAYVNKVQRMFDDTVFNFCGSWYRVNGTGRNVMIFPGRRYFSSILACLTQH